MSIFLDLEAGVDTIEDIESPSENEGSFIADDEEYSDNAADSGPINLSPAPLTQEQDQVWNSLLERAKARGSVRESTLVGEGSYDFRLLDNAPKLWVLSCIPGWEDIVVFHIGHCAPSELGIKAAFIMPHVDKQVWLEAEMSSALKTWLVDIPSARTVANHSTVDVSGSVAICTRLLRVPRKILSDVNSFKSWARSAGAFLTSFRYDMTVTVASTKEMRADANPMASMGDDDGN